MVNIFEADKNHSWGVFLKNGSTAYYRVRWIVRCKKVEIRREATKYKNVWLLGNGLCFENKLQKETFYCFPLLGISKAAARRLAVSPQYWARAAASKVVEQQASPKISNFPFWFSQNQKTNSILRKGFEIENSLAVMSPLNGHNKGPHKRSFWYQHLCSEQVMLYYSLLWNLWCHRKQWKNSDVQRE